MPEVRRDGVSIHYEADGTGPAVVFIQGLGYGRWMWRWQREALRPDYRIIAPDNRGTGRSAAGLPPLVPRLPTRIARPLLLWRAGHSIETLAADLEAVLDDAGIRQAHLIGASLGGMIALAYALEYTRAASLTLCATTPGGEAAAPIPESTREQLFATAPTPRQQLRERMRPAFSSRFYTRNPHLVDRILEWRLETDAPELARAAQARAASDFDVADQLGRIRIPSLVVHGTDDAVVPVENARLLADGLPEADLELIEGGAHLVTIEHSEDVTARIENFLAGVA